jgi:GH25 family lysozyme M1 (1,4-beta-N-acetylmuramidase)
MTVFGWDASHYDWGRGPMNVASAVNAGVSFMTHKATEGTSYTDTQYDNAAARARGVVPLFGAYHVLHSGSVNTQVDHFLSMLSSASPWWQDGPFLVQLDCERWPTDFPSASAIRAWCDRFVAVTGGTHRPIVYASAGQYGNSLAGVDYPLWNARYPSSRAASFRSLYPGDAGSGWAAYSGQVPAIWQYTSSATIGSQPTCDANAYRGTLAELRALTLMKGPDMADFFTDHPQAANDLLYGVLAIITGEDPTGRGDEAPNALHQKLGKILAQSQANGANLSGIRDALGTVTLASVMSRFDAIEQALTALGASVEQLAAHPAASGTVHVAGDLTVQ